MKTPTEANRIRLSTSGYIILWAQPLAIPTWKTPLLSICLMAKISCVLCAKTSRDEGVAWYKSILEGELWETEKNRVEGASANRLALASE